MTLSSVLGAVLVVMLLGFAFLVDATQPDGTDYEVEHWWNEGFASPVRDRAYKWSFDEAQDMQEPELPTGCEATAASTLCRMRGFVVAKLEVARAMEKSDGEDFVHAFWGDPFDEHGWACMAPCIVDAVNSLGELRGYAAFDRTGTKLGELELPAEVWVTMGLQEPQWSGHEQDGYRLAWNPHAVTVTAVGEDSVECVDPLVGVTTYDRAVFEGIFDEMGRQAVVVMPWD